MSLRTALVVLALVTWLVAVIGWIPLWVCVLVLVLIAIDRERA